jgi:hypothetical protein
MPPDSDAKKPNWSHLVCAIGGVLVGSWWVRNQVEEAKKSRAEIDDPDQVEEVYWEIGNLLDQWEPPTFETEDDFTQDLADYLKAETDWEIETFPETREGKPDILVGDLLALELKLNPSKSELDRCIGQCAAYSRQWITWMVIIDASASDIGRLRDLLVDKGLDHIEVWHFS